MLKDNTKIIFVLLTTPTTAKRGQGLKGFVERNLSALLRAKVQGYTWQQLADVLTKQGYKTSAKTLRQYVWWCRQN